MLNMLTTDMTMFVTVRLHCRADANLNQKSASFETDRFFRSFSGEDWV